MGQRTLLRKARTCPHACMHPTTLETRVIVERTSACSCWEFVGLLPPGEGVGLQNRGQRDKRHSPGQCRQCLKSGVLEAEPKMESLIREVY